MSDEAPPATPAAGMSPGRQKLLILLAALGTGAVLLLILIAFAALIGRNYGDRHDAAPVTGKVEGERFAVSAADNLPGTGLLRITIATEASLGGRSSYSSSSGAADPRNLILLDKASGVSRKLLPDNKRRIIDHQFLPAVVESDESVPEDRDSASTEVVVKRTPPPAAYYMLRVRVGEGPTEDVLLGDIKSGRQAFVLTGVDGVDRVWMQSPTRVAMLMRQGRKLQYRAFDLPDLKLVISRPVEID